MSDIFVEQDIKPDFLKLQKMKFLYNALENGWTVKKKEKLYIFTKNHEGKKEVYLDSYLRRFMVTNLTIESFKS
tara:strand:+ start:112 stop:333 length:222 start_codon:yes stop_codon:yes gene_type:complete